jgi:hypothetical protein
MTTNEEQWVLTPVWTYGDCDEILQFALDECGNLQCVDRTDVEGTPIELIQDIVARGDYRFVQEFGEPGWCFGIYHADGYSYSVYVNVDPYAKSNLPIFEPNVQILEKLISESFTNNGNPRFGVEIVWFGMEALDMLWETKFGSAMSLMVGGRKVSEEDKMYLAAIAEARHNVIKLLLEKI